MEKRPINHGWPAQNAGREPSTHPNVVVGVTILTLLALFSTFFWAGILAAALLSPPEPSVTLRGEVDVVTIEDYVARGRFIVGAIVGFFGTAGTWALVDRILYPPSAGDGDEEDDDH